MGKNAIVGQSGGPTSVINASLAGVFESCKSRGADIVYGMCNGVAGLLEERVVDLSTVLTDDLDIELLKRTPSSFLGSCRYKLPDWHEDEAVYKKLFAILEKLNIGYFFYIGGNDSMDTIGKLADYGARIDSDIRFMGVPKTIDNDIYGTDVTFGFHSAVDIGTEVIDRIHTTANSHSRVMVIEIMGNKAGWLTLYSGLAGGADIILLPEIPYDIDKVAQACQKRADAGRNFSILAVAEGCFDVNEAKMKKKERARLRTEAGYTTATSRIAKQIQEMTGLETRTVVPGHMLRGGSPSAYDRILATQFGAHAAQLLKDKKFGYTVAMVDGKITENPLGDVAMKTKFVPVDCKMVKTAKDIGISFGD